MALKKNTITEYGQRCIKDYDCLSVCVQ